MPADGPVAAILAVGTELFRPGRRDRNTPLLTGRLASLGIPVVFSAVLPDDEETLVEAIRLALGRADWVFVAGGLGPTSDDRTRAAAAGALGVPLVLDEAAAERLRRRRYGSVEVNLRQAYVPEGATALPNSAGTAPGALAAGRLVLLPGPPRELEAMFDAEVAPRLPRGQAPAEATLLLAGMPESVLEERIADLTPLPDGPLSLSILASRGVLELRVAGRGADRLADQIAERAGPALFSRKPGDSLEARVGRMLRERGLRLAVAESLTGGLIGDRLTSVPGASGWFDLGVVAYADSAKRDLLGVPEATLASFGAVSEETARAMAEGVRQRAGGRALGLAVTGIAGPTGATPGKPVGTVWIALAGAETTAVRHRLPGGRELVRQLTATRALDLVRRTLE